MYLVGRQKTPGNADEEWVHVDWATREDGNNDRAVAELRVKYPEIAADPDNWRFDIICARDGTANVRLLRRAVPNPRLPRKKPRWG